MLVRLFLLFLVGGGVFWVVQALRGEPLLRVPGAWTVEAGQDETVRAALVLRQSMARLLLEGRAAQAAELLADVDGVLARMVEMSSMARTLRQEAALVGGASAGRVGASLERLAADSANALGWLTEAHGVLLETAAAEADEAVDRLRASLSAHAEELKAAVEARQEINATVQRGRA